MATKTTLLNAVIGCEYIIASKLMLDVLSTCIQLAKITSIPTSHDVGTVIILLLAAASSRA